MKLFKYVVLDKILKYIENRGKLYIIALKLSYYG